MNKVMCALMATAIMGSFAVETIPVSAAVLYPIQPKSETAIVDAAYHGHGVRRRPAYGHYNRNYVRRPAHVHGGGYWHGYRGYRKHRPGYRYYNGWWYPAAAFVGGAIVGGAIASEPTYVEPSYGNAHVQWCYNRYRSYRASDNTFQPNSGPRRQCVSPYG